MQQPCGSVDMAQMCGLKQNANAQHEYAPGLTAQLGMYNLRQYTLHKIGKPDERRLDLLVQHNIEHKQTQPIGKTTQAAAYLRVRP